ncbi:MAG: hypothetical protein EBU90_20560, partial [Proteobacteria bacterium]|nr:hypothetical protein [Pseudomonadota bacterium]
MNNNINLLSNLSLYGALVFEVDNAGWPENPKLGTFIMKDNNLYGYLKIGGLETWYPFSHHTVSYIHTQAMPSTTWVVNHGLGTTNLFIQVKDNNGNIIGVGKEDIDSNSFRLTFTSAITGTVIVVAPDSIDVPEIKAQVLDIGNGSVLVNSGGIDVIGGVIRVDGNTVLTSANIQPQIDASIAAVVGAAPAALDTLKEIADQLVSDESAVAALTTTVAGKANAVHTHVISDVTGLQNVLDTKAATSSLATVATTGSYADLTNKPTLSMVASTGSYTDLTNKPVFQTVASTGSYTDLYNLPDLFSGSYTDLTNKPTRLGQFTNDVGYQTASEVSSAINNVVGAAPSGLGTLAEIAAQLQSDESALLALTATVQSLAPVATSGSYADLTNKPTLFSGSYADLTGKPSIPSKTSDLTNDSGYQTSAQVDARVQQVIGTAPAALDTLGEIAAQLQSDESAVSALTTIVATKVPQTRTVNGKALSADVTLTTSDVSEGTNLYFTNARASSAAPVQSVAGKTGVVTLTKDDVGLGNVDNTSDATKSVASAGKWTTARTESLTGDVAGSASVDGSANWTITTTLANSGVTAGAYGSASSVASVTVDAKGRITSASSTPIAITSTAVSGLATSATTDTTNATNISSGTLNALRLPTSGVTAGTYGSASSVSAVTVDTYGRVTAASSTPIAISASAVSGLAASATTDTTSATNISAGTLSAARLPAFTGDATSTAGTSALTLANSGVTAGTYSNTATQHNSFTVDAKGRVTAVGTAVTITPAFASITGKPTTLSGYGITDAVSTAQVGVANGVASLDSSGLVPAAQLPSYVDDVLEYTNLAGFPATGETGKIYVAKDTNKTYRWSGSAYIYITSGAVDSVAGKTGVVTLTKSDVGLGNVDNTADATKSVASAATLTTARTIAGVSFDGSANINIPFSGLSSKPTTVAGYGITDAATLTGTETLTNKSLTSPTVTGTVNNNSLIYDTTFSNVS